MMQFFLLNENIPFSISLAVMLGISILEILSVLAGVGLSHFLDNLLHHPHLEINIHHDVDVHDDLPLFTRFLGWIRYGHVPILVVFISFLAAFSILGFVEQTIAKNVYKVLSWQIAIWPPLFLSIPFVRSISLILGRCCFKDETTAVSTDSFIGKFAIITVGTARQGFPTEAKLIDQYKQTHYLLVEPIDSSSLKTGTKVLLVEKKNHIFLVRKDS